MSERWLQMEVRPTEWYVVRGRECAIALIIRPSWCDRGNWLAQLYTVVGASLHIDGADGWPRYYFDQCAARSECEAWIRKRGQWADDPAAVPPLKAFGMDDPAETLHSVITGAEFVDTIRDALPDAFADLTDVLPGDLEASSGDDRALLYRARLYHIGPLAGERDE